MILLESKMLNYIKTKYATNIRNRNEKYNKSILLRIEKEYDRRKMNDIKLKGKIVELDEFKSDLNKLSNILLDELKKLSNTKFRLIRLLANSGIINILDIGDITVERDTKQDSSSRSRGMKSLGKYTYDIPIVSSNIDDTAICEFLINKLNLDIDIYSDEAEEISIELYDSAIDAIEHVLKITGLDKTIRTVSINDELRISVGSKYPIRYNDFNDTDGYYITDLKNKLRK